MNNVYTKGIGVLALLSGLVVVLWVFFSLLTPPSQPGGGVSPLPSSTPGIPRSVPTPTSEVAPTPTSEVAPTPTSEVAPTPTSSEPSSVSPTALFCVDNVISQLGEYESKPIGLYYPNVDFTKLIRSYFGELEQNNCPDPLTILSTGDTREGEIIFEVNQNQRIYNYKQAWIVVSADQTHKLNPGDKIGEVEIAFEQTTNTEDLVLGRTIADWSYRDLDGQLPITRFGSDVYPLHFDLAGTPTTTTQGPPYRASQLLVTGFPINIYNENLRTITLRDTSPTAGLQVLAIILDAKPEGRFGQRAVDEGFSPLCFDGVNANDTALVRNTEDFFLRRMNNNGPESRIFNHNLDIGCGENMSYVYLKNPLESVSIPFFISEDVFEKRSVQGDSSDVSRMSITIDRTSLEQKYIYLFLNARNLCHQAEAIEEENRRIGWISIDQESIVELEVGRTIRQGRTNFTLDCGPANRYMQLDQLSRPNLQVLPGLPFPINPNPDETSNAHAELWVDVLRLTLPADVGESFDLSIAVYNQLTDGVETDSVFVTLFAITLGEE